MDEPVDRQTAHGRKQRFAIGGLLLAAIAAAGIVAALGFGHSSDSAKQPGSDEGIGVEEQAATPGPETRLSLPDTTDGIHRAVVFLRCTQETVVGGASATCTDYARRTPLAALDGKIETGFSA